MTQEVKIISGIGLLTLVIVGVALFFLGGSSSSSTTNTSAPVDQNLLVKSDSNKIATDSAKVTIVEFGDYQCPACEVAFPVVRQIMNEFSGKVNLVFRHFPLPQHPNALIAAEAAEAAGEQGKYWQMHDKLYENQKVWSDLPNPLDTFVGYATEIGLNVDQFKTAVTQKKFQQKIENDKTDGIKANVNATPTFYINGVKLNDFRYDSFKKEINKAL